MQHKYRRKLIEVDLPLDEINAESSREKSIRHGHPSTLHLWWARRPLAACRAVIFASMVDDPSECDDEFPTKDQQDIERERLHDLIKRLVKWENSSDENLIAEARYEIAKSVARSKKETAPTEPSEVLQYLNDKALPIYDPFAGGGSIPLEAQRLGLRAVASDLNPVAVLINKALIELPPKFAGQPPINPDADPMGMLTGKFKGRGKNRKPVQVPWRAAAGLANDIRYYGKWMRDEAFKRIGHYYPKAKLPDGSEATVIAWLWARTVPCPNPACGVDMPLMTTFQLSKKPNNRHWTKPIVNRETNTISFEVQNHSDGIPIERTVIRGGRGVVCIACNGTSTHAYIREQSKAGNMGEQTTAIVAEGDRKRLYLSPNDEHLNAALDAEPIMRSIPQQQMPTTAYKVSGRGYGITHWKQLFTKRQLTALTTFSELVPKVHEQVVHQGATSEYADAVCTYLALAIGRVADMGSSYARWHNAGDFVTGVFARQAIPMIWDFAEGNTFSNSTGNYMAHIEWIARVVQRLSLDTNSGKVYQADASTTIHANEGPVIVTDPPYYDNISYAELSDFFYVWLRPLLRNIYPNLFAGILVPIQEEMIAAPRFDNSRERFEELMNKTLKLIRARCSPEFPSSIFYAYKQQEERRGGVASTGWEMMLTALVNANFQIIGTWPMRTEMGVRANAMSANTLASSVILVCRPRAEDAPIATRRQFLNELERELPAALEHLTSEGHIAPVDLAQAAIGPGMQVYSKYARVETVSGEPVSVRGALIEINRVITEYHRREQGDLDSASQFCAEWLQEYGYAEGEYGRAEVLAQAKNVAPESAPLNGLLSSGGGKAKLRRMDDFGPERPLSGGMTAWEGCMRMAYHLNREHGHGIAGAAAVARDMSGVDGGVDSVERLARILYDYHDRKSDSANAVIFNALASSWQDILTEMQSMRSDRLL